MRLHGPVPVKGDSKNAITCVVGAIKKDGASFLFLMKSKVGSSNFCHVPMEANIKWTNWLNQILQLARED